MREKIYKYLFKKNKRIKFIKYISKNAIINKNVKIGCGSVIMPGCVINNGVLIEIIVLSIPHHQ